MLFLSFCQFFSLLPIDYFYAQKYAQKKRRGTLKIPRRFPTGRLLPAEHVLHTANHRIGSRTYSMHRFVYAAAETLILLHHLGANRRHSCHGKKSGAQAFHKAHSFLIHHIKPPDCAELFDGICPLK